MKPSSNTWAFLVAQLVLDVPHALVDCLQLLLQHGQRRLTLQLLLQQRQQAVQLGAHVAQLGRIVDAFGLDLENGDLVDQLADRYRGQDGVHAVGSLETGHHDTALPACGPDSRIYAEFAPRPRQHPRSVTATASTLRSRRHNRLRRGTQCSEQQGDDGGGGGLAGLLGIGSAQAQVQASGSAALTSDYVWRGSSQSDGDPAVQAGAKVSIPSGWYASVWAPTFRSSRTMVRAASSTWWRAGPVRWPRTGHWMPT